jgi:hypothetical protein
VLHLYMSVYKSFVLGSRSVCLQKPMLHTCTGLPRRTRAAHGHVCLQLPVLKLYVSVYFCARTGRFCPHKPIGHLELYCREKHSVSVETVLFVSVVSIASKCRNKLKNLLVDFMN